MVTLQEIELLAGILQRAGVTQIEALFLNSVLGRLRATAVEHEQLLALKENESPKTAQDGNGVSV